ncbi:MAG: hypothetical protein RL120_00305 [Gammaproteobacteria bacterium]
MGRIFSVKTIFVLVLAGSASVAVGQDDIDSSKSADLPETAEPESPVRVNLADLPPRTIEEITVVGQRSLARLRLRIDQKSDEIFSFFNDNNSHDRFDIICSKRRPTGTYILQRECEPKFLRDRRVQLTRDYMLGVGVPFSQYDLVGQTEGDYAQLQNEMMQLMAENKDFADNLAELADLTANYQAHRRAMFGEN